MVEGGVVKIVEIERVWVYLSVVNVCCLWFISFILMVMLKGDVNFEVVCSKECGVFGCDV